MLTTEQKLLSALCHLGIFVGLPFIAPLGVLLLSNDYFVKQQAKEALGFQLAMSVVAGISAILIILLVGIPLLLVSGVVVIVMPIIATVKIADNIDYSYPIVGDLVRRNF